MLIEADLPQPGGPCICYLYSDDVSAVTATHIHPRIIETLSFVVKPSGASDVGMFCTNHLSTGDLIWSEAPIIFIPAESTPNIFENTWNRLNSSQQATLMSLRNAHPAGVDIVEGILRTNFIGVELDDNNDDGSSSSYRGLFPIISRCNHSCSSNATYRFDPIRFSLELRACRPIIPNEEIHVQYIDVLQPASDRQRLLRELYMFDCMCPSCIHPNPSPARAESDSRRERIREWPKTHTSFEDWLYDTSLPSNLVISDSLELVGLLQEEGLECMGRFALDMVCASLAAVGEDEDAFKYWAKKAQAMARMDGDEHAMVSYYEEALVDPSSSHMWGIRLNLDDEDTDDIVEE